MAELLCALPPPPPPLLLLWRAAEPGAAMPYIACHSSGVGAMWWQSAAEAVWWQSVAEAQASMAGSATLCAAVTPPKLLWCAR
jgi:hypothetical protein